jgi:hypothetical protein
MNSPSLFCVPSTNFCFLASEWGSLAQVLTSILTLVVGIVGLYKVYQELRRLREQRAKEVADRETAASLKRTEFFLTQHRRLFDDADLSKVLSMVDADSDELIEEDMWNKKRKFLTFFEEIALLIDSGQIGSEASYYMFGHYAQCAREGRNFRVGLDMSPAHWNLFFKFAEASARYRTELPSGPNSICL